MFVKVIVCMHITAELKAYLLLVKSIRSLIIKRQGKRSRKKRTKVEY